MSLLTQEMIVAGQRIIKEYRGSLPSHALAIRTFEAMEAARDRAANGHDAAFRIALEINDHVIRTGDMSPRDAEETDFARWFEAVDGRPFTAMAHQAE